MIWSRLKRICLGQILRNLRNVLFPADQTQSGSAYWTFKTSNQTAAVRSDAAARSRLEVGNMVTILF